jgi:hypothetical protein
MAVVTLDEIQQWLAPTKFGLNEIDVELEDTSRSFIFGRLEDRFDVSTWVDVSTTPDLVRKVVALYIAIMEYERAIAEDYPEGDSYSKRLWSRMETLIDGIIADEIHIGQDQDETLSALESPAFYPTDVQDEWSGVQGEDERRKASIGIVF